MGYTYAEYQAIKDKIKNIKPIIPKRNEKGQAIVKRTDWE